MSLWKTVERRLCEYLGLFRVPITGRTRGSSADCGKRNGDTPWLSVEIKHREKLPGWIDEAMQQAVASQTDSNQLPLVVLHQKQQKTEDSFVLLRLGDFVTHFGTDKGLHWRPAEIMWRYEELND